MSVESDHSSVRCWGSIGDDFHANPMTRTLCRDVCLSDSIFFSGSMILSREKSRILSPNPPRHSFICNKWNNRSFHRSPWHRRSFSRDSMDPRKTNLFLDRTRIRWQLSTNSLLRRVFVFPVIDHLLNARINSVFSLSHDESILASVASIDLLIKRSPVQREIRSMNSNISVPSNRVDLMLFAGGPFDSQSSDERGRWVRWRVSPSSVWCSAVWNLEVIKLECLKTFVLLSTEEKQRFARNNLGKGSKGDLSRCIQHLKKKHFVVAWPSEVLFEMTMALLVGWLVRKKILFNLSYLLGAMMFNSFTDQTGRKSNEIPLKTTIVSRCPPSPTPCDTHHARSLSFVFLEFDSAQWHAAASGICLSSSVVPLFMLSAKSADTNCSDFSQVSSSTCLSQESWRSEGERKYRLGHDAINSHDESHSIAVFEFEPPTLLRRVWWMQWIDVNNEVHDLDRSKQV